MVKEEELRENSSYAERFRFGALDFYPLWCKVNPEEIKALKESIEKDMGQIDFIVHSIAFAPKEGLVVDL